jgi:hypothetical protein
MVDMLEGAKGIRSSVPFDLTTRLRKVNFFKI